ncbi:MAG: hypothetical protein CFE24_01230 [Flavobacterium sp. BFFFF2]|nr:MAG: hypothetical protein CFE24_01230 [Flavobacterium sp. BFFFF2]
MKLARGCVGFAVNSLEIVKILESGKAAMVLSRKSKADPRPIGTNGSNGAFDIKRRKPSGLQVREL